MLQVGLRQINTNHFLLKPCCGESTLLKPPCLRHSRSGRRACRRNISSQPQAGGPCKKDRPCAGFCEVYCHDTISPNFRSAEERLLQRHSKGAKPSDRLAVLQQELRNVSQANSEERRGDPKKCAAPINKILSKCYHLRVEKLLAVASSSLRLHSFGLLRSAKPGSSKVRASASATSEAPRSACHTSKFTFFRVRTTSSRQRGRLCPWNRL